MSDDTKPTVVEALNRVMEDVMAVGKTGHNQQQNYSFRGVDAVVNAVGPAFRKHGIVPAPIKAPATYRDVEVGKNRTKQRECTVTVTYRFYGPAGDYIDAEVPSEALDSGDKATSKAMSVAYRIVLLQVLSIPTDEPDPDSMSVERSAPVEDERDLIPAKDAKGQVLAAVGGDKDAATHAWNQAGLNGRRQVSEPELAFALSKIAGGNGTEAPCDPGTPSDAEASTEAPVPPVDPMQETF